MDDLKTLTFEEHLSASLNKYEALVSDLEVARQRAESLAINGLDDEDGYGEVLAARKSARSMRTGVEKLRKELKADALKYGRAVDARAQELKALIAPIEETLQGKLDEVDNERARIEREEAERLERILQARFEKIHELDPSVTRFDCDTWGVEEFDARFEAAKEAKAKADAEREEADKKAAAERKELEQLRREKEERDRELEELRREKAEREKEGGVINFELDRNATKALGELGAESFEVEVDGEVVMSGGVSVVEPLMTVPRSMIDNAETMLCDPDQFEKDRFVEILRMIVEAAEDEDAPEFEVKS